MASIGNGTGTGTSSSTTDALGNGYLNSPGNGHDGHGHRHRHPPPPLSPPSSHEHEHGSSSTGSREGLRERAASYVRRLAAMPPFDPDDVLRLDVEANACGSVSTASAVPLRPEGSGRRSVSGRSDAPSSVRVGQSTVAARCRSVSVSAESASGSRSASASRGHMRRRGDHVSYIALENQFDPATLDVILAQQLDDDDGGGGGGRGGGGDHHQHHLHHHRHSRHQSPDTDAGSELSQTSSWGIGGQSNGASRGQSQQANKPSTRTLLGSVFRQRVWIPFKRFCDSSFPDKYKEAAYQREQWRSYKITAMWAAIYMVLTWAVGFSAVNWQHISIFQQYAYIGIDGFFSLPFPFMVWFNGRRRFPILYQVFCACVAWDLGLLHLTEAYLCQRGSACSRDAFLFLFVSMYAFPTIALIGLGLNRVLHLVTTIIFFIVALVLIYGDPETKIDSKGGARNMVLFLLFHFFLSINSYLREYSERQLFTVREQLTVQYRAVQSAQVLEQEAQESKKRFVSYIFHEVRVPLNAAMLAVQNLDEEGVFSTLAPDQQDMARGLNSSLGMMEKVLNDVLSFNRMESGNLMQARKPFDFHKTINIVALSQRPKATAHSGAERVTFSLNLDPRIEQVAGGVFIGDEMRLRQVVSNLVSNALKFTKRGSVSITTKLLYPPLTALSQKAETESSNQSADKSVTPPDSDGEEMLPVLLQPMKSVSTTPSMAVIRVEVADSGVGMTCADLKDNRLFSPYVQTEIGRRQGGKGSGLGLALVMQIVKLSNGRLGVESELGKGSTFWFEIPYAIPPPDVRLTGGPSKVDVSTFSALRMEPASTPERFDPNVRRRSISAPPVMMHHERRSSAPELRLLQDERLRPVSPMDGEGGTPPNLHHMALAASGLPRHMRVSTPPPVPSGMSRPGYPRRTTAPAAPLSEAAHAAARSSPLAPLHALVVDDDPLTRKLMTRMVKRQGHDVTTAEDGREALDLILAGHGRRGSGAAGSTRTFDIVFLDNQMPQMSGVEVTREVRAAGSNVFIVGCTGNALREDQDEYLAAGANVIIPKPIHQTSLVARLAEARDRRDAADMRRR